MGRPNRLEGRPKFDQYYNARKTEDKEQMVKSKRTERWTNQEASCEQVILILHAKSPIAYLSRSS